MYRIGIIDSGLSKHYKSINNNNISGFSLKIVNNKIIKYQNYFDYDGHGTAVTRILDKQICNCEIVMIKIDAKSINRYGFDTWLCETLQYLYNNERFDVINMSCGFTLCREHNKLSTVCECFKKRGTFLVAAYSNDGAMTYPAIYDSVIGIDKTDDYFKNGQYDYIDSTINIKSPFISWSFLGKIEGFEYTKGNSFSAPFFSAKIVKMLQAGVSRDNVIKELKNDAITCAEDNENSLDYDPKFSIKKAIAFPFNKEIYTLARYEDLLSYEIAGFYDYDKLGKVGKHIGLLINCNSNKQVLNYNEISWADDFDTFILGHCEILSKKVNRNLLQEIVELCILNHKNLYMFDEPTFNNEDEYALLKRKFENNNLWIRWPEKINDIHLEWGGKLYDISSPVVCIAGTSSKQGKFSIQISLRKKLREKDINVFNFGTEPSSELLGFEGVYTIGYNALMPYNGWKNVIAVNHSLHRLETHSPDLIITGLQGRSIPYNVASFDGYPIKQIEFILGSAPDTYVLCVNYDDCYNTIKRTIRYLESIFPAKVLYLCLNDTQRPANALIRFIYYIKHMVLYGKPTAFVTNDKAISKIAERIIKYFSK